MGYSLSLLVSQFKNLILCEKKHSRITASLTKLGRPDVIDGGLFFFRRVSSIESSTLAIGYERNQKLDNDKKTIKRTHAFHFIFALLLTNVKFPY